MLWKPSKALGLMVGLAIVLTMAGVDAFLIDRMLKQSFGVSLYSTGLLFVCTLSLLALMTY